MAWWNAGIGVPMNQMGRGIDLTNLEPQLPMPAGKKPTPVRQIMPTVQPNEPIRNPTPMPLQPMGAQPVEPSLPIRNPSPMPLQPMTTPPWAGGGLGMDNPMETKPLTPPAPTYLPRDTRRKPIGKFGLKYGG